ncbi:hypothetical protein GLOTRDRAFT_129557 [Gloeophyllum trabeum ATCC 11539]|uniref:Uncharacterized protein n=1 Tax=Gloeophyllum trabeum (strain ATCC 11539 / FP-39264 / Madison 617) TaxID=670483 RepID=S7Q6X8_GLOTA|nr:uncharacterized protein GLOTRDRAFT_129557 [Gloeophyllum trabeum ATCC 11539]EPQ55277.1 hypothetical protein GLOTRDRAFT_129557 [Gloeophyllum trabeum ATCC 11539]
MPTLKNKIGPIAGAPPSEVILPEYVYFKNPAGQYLKHLPNKIGWYGLKWEPTQPDLNTRFKIIQIPNHPGKFYATGPSATYYTAALYYKRSGDTKYYDSDQQTMPSNAPNPNPDFVWRIVSLGGNDIYLIRDATYDSETVFFSNHDNRRYKLWDHNDNSWLDVVRATTYANDSNRIKVERAAVKTEVYDVKYKVDDADLVELNPTVAIEKVLENNTGSEGSQSVSYTYTKSDEGNWNNVAGIELGQSFTFKAEVPFIASTEIGISFTESYQHEWGGSTIESTSVTTSTNITVPAHTTIKLTVLIYKTQLNIPFTYTERITLYDGTSVENKNKEGIYYNVQFIKDHATTDIIERK